MKTIIHVDNSDFFRKQMKSFLESQGFEVESFDSAQEANFSIGSGGCSMVITGLAFSDLEGVEFTEKIAETFSGPVIVVSSSVDNDMEAKLLARGIKAAINKSSSWKQIIKPYLEQLK